MQESSNPRDNEAISTHQEFKITLVGCIHKDSRERTVVLSLQNGEGKMNWWKKTTVPTIRNVLFTQPKDYLQVVVEIFPTERSLHIYGFTLCNKS